MVRAIAFVAPDEMGELKDVEKVLKMEIPIASGRRWDLVPGVDTRKPKRKQPSGRRRAVAAGMTTTGARRSRAAVAAAPQRPMRHALRPSRRSNGDGIQPMTVQP